MLAAKEALALGFLKAVIQRRRCFCISRLWGDFFDPFSSFTSKHPSRRKQGKKHLTEAVTHQEKTARFLPPTCTTNKPRSSSRGSGLLNWSPSRCVRFLFALFTSFCFRFFFGFSMLQKQHNWFRSSLQHQHGNYITSLLHCGTSLSIPFLFCFVLFFLALILESVLRVFGLQKKQKMSE